MVATQLIRCLPRPFKESDERQPHPVGLAGMQRRQALQKSGHRSFCPALSCSEMPVCCAKWRAFFRSVMLVVDLQRRICVITTVQNFRAAMVLLSVHHIVVTSIPEASLFGLSLATRSSPFAMWATRAGCVKSTLISAARHDQFAAVPLAISMVRFYNRVHHKGTSFLSFSGGRKSISIG